MRIICLVAALMSVNMFYVTICFDMESIVAETNGSEVAESIVESDSSTEENDLVLEVINNFSLADLLDLDILDFDVEELTNKHEPIAQSKSKRSIDENTI
jgi:hypothetical protein